MNLWKTFFLSIFQRIYWSIKMACDLFENKFLNYFKYKWAFLDSTIYKYILLITM